MLLCCDTDIFLALEKRGREDGDFYRSVCDIFDEYIENSGKYDIVASAIVKAEVLPDATERNTYKYIQRLFNKIELFPVDQSVIELTATLRNATLAEDKRKHKLKTPDAIHLATAVKANADYFCTGDSPVLNLGSEWISGIVKQEIRIVKPPLPDTTGNLDID